MREREREKVDGIGHMEEENDIQERKITCPVVRLLFILGKVKTTIGTIAERCNLVQDLGKRSLLSVSIRYRMLESRFSLSLQH